MGKTKNQFKCQIASSISRRQRELRLARGRGVGGVFSHDFLQKVVNSVADQTVEIEQHESLIEESLGFLLHIQKALRHQKDVVMRRKELTHAITRSRALENQRRLIEDEWVNEALNLQNQPVYPQVVNPPTEPSVQDEPAVPEDEPTPGSDPMIQ